MKTANSPYLLRAQETTKSASLRMIFSTTLRVTLEQDEQAAVVIRLQRRSE
jgi:hypothetical protein